MNSSPDAHAMASEFHKTLEKHMNSCYEWKKVRRKSSDKPWISDAVRAQIKRRKGIFREQGRSEHWKRVDRCIKRTINYRKALYNKTQKTRLESIGKTGQWYNIAKYLVTDETPARWSITDLQPGQEPAELARDLAGHFSKITNASPALSPSDIPVSISLSLIHI